MQFALFPYKTSMYTTVYTFSRIHSFDQASYIHNYTYSLHNQPLYYRAGAGSPHILGLKPMTRYNYTNTTYN